MNHGQMIELAELTAPLFNASPRTADIQGRAKRLNDKQLSVRYFTFDEAALEQEVGMDHMPSRAWLSAVRETFDGLYSVETMTPTEMRGLAKKLRAAGHKHPAASINVGLEKRLGLSDQTTPCALVRSRFAVLDDVGEGFDLLKVRKTFWLGEEYSEAHSVTVRLHPNTNTNTYTVVLNPQWDNTTDC
jgi:hypothetical protein